MAWMEIDELMFHMLKISRYDVAFERNASVAFAICIEYWDGRCTVHTMEHRNIHFAGAVIS
jgi:hypothetical protein